MKNIPMMMAAVSALALAAPAVAQPRHDDRSMSQSWNGERMSTGQLQARFDAGVQSGAISRREAVSLRGQLRQLSMTERQYARGGFDGWERANLRERSRTLSMNIAAAERSGGGRYDNRDNRDGRDGRYGDNDGPGNRGDRFSGDLRVGQHVSARQVALPMEYRARYQDNETAYYRYDDKRVYRIDRLSGVIMAMFDLQD